MCVPSLLCHAKLTSSTHEGPVLWHGVSVVSLGKRCACAAVVVSVSLGGWSVLPALTHAAAIGFDCVDFASDKSNNIYLVHDGTFRDCNDVHSAFSIVYFTATDGRGKGYGCKTYWSGRRKRGGAQADVSWFRSDEPSDLYDQRNHVPEYVSPVQILC